MPGQRATLRVVLVGQMSQFCSTAICLSPMVEAGNLNESIPGFVAEDADK